MFRVPPPGAKPSADTSGLAPLLDKLRGTLPSEEEPAPQRRDSLEWRDDPPPKTVPWTAHAPSQLPPVFAPAETQHSSIATVPQPWDFIPPGATKWATRFERSVGFLTVTDEGLRIERVGENLRQRSEFTVPNSKLLAFVSFVQSNTELKHATWTLTAADLPVKLPGLFRNVEDFFDWASHQKNMPGELYISAGPQRRRSS